MIKELLMSSSYWTLNKRVVKTLGIETAFFLTNLVEADKLLADDEGWFYQTIETIEKLTTLSRRKQDIAIKQLTEIGVLIQKNKGIPMKRYFKLNSFKINELLTVENVQFVQNVQTRMNESYKLECAKRTTSKELINKQLNDKESINIKGAFEKKNELDVRYKSKEEFLNRTNYVEETSKYKICGYIYDYFYSKINTNHYKLDNEQFEKVREGIDLILQTVEKYPQLEDLLERYFNLDRQYYSIQDFTNLNTLAYLMSKTGIAEIERFDSDGNFGGID